MDARQLDDRSAPISGIWLPLVTPFREGRLDERSLLRLLRHYLGQPVDGLILAATTGEGLTLDEAETERLAALSAAEVAGRLPLYLRLSGSDTRKLAKTLAQRAAWPVEGYLIACPYYVRPSQEGLYRHFAALAEATDRPILIYNIPYRTGVNMTNETLLRLAELPNIVGLKDCAADAAQSAELLRRKPRDFPCSPARTPNSTRRWPRGRMAGSSPRRICERRVSPWSATSSWRGTMPRPARSGMA